MEPFDMDRREVLTALAASSTTLLTAGCTVPGRTSSGSGGGHRGTADRTETPANTASPTATKADRSIEFDPERVAREVTIGDRTEGVEGLRPHSIRVWNDSPAERTVAMELLRGTRTEPVLDEAYAVAADASVVVVLKDPAAYTAVLRSGEATATIDVPERWFDCNYSTTEVALSPDDGFRWQFVTTFAECRS